MRLLLILTLVLSTAAFAKTTTETSTYSAKNTIKNIKNWIKDNNNNFRIGIAQGSLATNARARATGVDESVNESRNTKLQLQAGWETIKTKEIGYSAYLTYQDIAEAFGQEDVRSMRASANVTWGVKKDVYTYGGLNWNKYYGSNEIESGIDAGLGYQIGAGIKFHERANIELEYLTLLNEGRIDGVNYDVAAKGLMIKLNTPIRF